MMQKEINRIKYIAEEKIIQKVTSCRSGKTLFLLVYTAYRKGWPLIKVDVLEYTFVSIFRSSPECDLEAYV
mgnify:CR=1 FL=1